MAQQRDRAWGRGDRHDADYAKRRDRAMRVAVTGARGRIGRAVVALLAADARVDEVEAIDVVPGEGPPAAGVREVVRDTRDPLLARDLEGADALVHLAFRVLDPRDAESVNVDGSRNAFEAALEAGSGRSCTPAPGAVYGAHPDNPVPLHEDSPLRPAPSPTRRRRCVWSEMLGELGGRRGCDPAPDHRPRPRRAAAVRPPGPRAALGLRPAAAVHLGGRRG